MIKFLGFVGENNNMAKLMNDDVKQIKELLRSTNLFHKEIALRFNISKGVIADISSNRTWLHIQ